MTRLVTRQDPAVVAWQCALAPRPRFTTGGRHWWRELVTDSWRAANHAWELDREAVAIGYATEMAEYQAANPRPTLGDFMRHLSARATVP